VHPFLQAISHWVCLESTLNSIAATCSLNVTGIGVEIRPAQWAVRNKTAPKTNSIQWLLGREAGVKKALLAGIREGYRQVKENRLRTVLGSSSWNPQNSSRMQFQNHL